MIPACNGIVAMGPSGEVGRAAFWQRVNALVQLLKAHPAKRCALVCESASACAVGLIALSHTGRVTIVPPAPRAGSLRAANAAVDVVLTDRPEQFEGFETLALPTATGDEPVTPRAIDDDAIIEFYTSGSNDRPSCVRQDFRMLRVEMEEMEHEWGEQLGEAMVVGTVPHYHRYGLQLTVFWPLFAGRAFYEQACPTPAELREAVGARDCIIVSSPAFLSRVQHDADLPLVGQVRAIFSSGAPLPDAVAEQFADGWGRAPIEIYGSTETGGIAWRVWTDAERRAQWRPFQRAQIELRPEAAGDRLWIRAPWLEGWMASGDLARHDDEGGFALLGRADEVVKLADKRVSLAEMRGRLLAHSWVVDARLMLIPGKSARLGAAVILDSTGAAKLEREGRPAVREGLAAWLGEMYDPVVLPRKWRFPERWPDNVMSKVTREYLSGLFEQTV